MSGERVSSCDHIAGYCTGQPITTINEEHRRRGWYECNLEGCMITGTHYHQKPEFDSSKINSQ